jgi:transcriptional regulator with PAS, ATPase and Fis domain
VRVIAATNRDLEKFMADGRFRQDLFYRLSVITLSLPPLRQRLQDLPALISHFVARFAREYGKPVRGASDECMDRLLHWDWPGNVRELVNVLERSVILTRGELVQASDLPAELHAAAPAPTNLREIRSEAKARAFAEAEPAAIVSALQQNSWNVSNAADKLGISRVQLYRIMKKHGLKRPKP